MGEVQEMTGTLADKWDSENVYIVIEKASRTYIATACDEEHANIIAGLLSKDTGTYVVEKWAVSGEAYMSKAET